MQREPVIAHGVEVEAAAGAEAGAEDGVVDADAGVEGDSAGVGVDAGVEGDSVEAVVAITVVAETIEGEAGHAIAIAADPDQEADQGAETIEGVPDLEADGIGPDQGIAGEEIGHLQGAGG